MLVYFSFLWRVDGTLWTLKLHRAYNDLKECKGWRSSWSHSWLCVCCLLLFVFFVATCFLFLVICNAYECVPIAMHRNLYTCKISTFDNVIFLLVIWTFEKFRYLKDLVGLILLTKPKFFVTKHLWKNPMALKNRHGYLAGFPLKTQIMYPPIKRPNPQPDLIWPFSDSQKPRAMWFFGGKKIQIKNTPSRWFSKF